jgi:hypothetical protein
MKEQDYSYPLVPGTEADMLYVRFRKERGQIVYFVVQYSALIDDKYHEIMRFDTCHGYVHRHTFHLQAEEFILDLSTPDDPLNDFYTQSLEHIKKNFREIKENYLRT